MIIKKVNGYDDYYIAEDGTILKAMKPWNAGGYKDIKLNGNHHLIHRLVAEHFINNPCNETDVNHKDGNRTNNHYTNLEWCSRSENLKHSFRELGQTPVRNFIGCELYRNNELLGIFKSIKEACRYAQLLGAKFYQLYKNHFSKEFKIVVLEV